MVRFRARWSLSTRSVELGANLICPVPRRPERFAVHLGLEAKEIEQAIRVTTSLAHELITLERQVRDEHHRFSHFCLWLAYGALLHASVGGTFAVVD
jgi:hypothetical protein